MQSSGSCGAVREAFRAVRAVRAGVLVSLFGALVVFLPQQIREVYGILAGDIIRRAPQIFSLFLFLALFTIVQRKIAALAFAPGEKVPWRYPVITRATTAVATALVPLAMALGMVMAANNMRLDGVQTETLQRIPELSIYVDAISTSSIYLYIGAALCFCIAACGAIGSFRDDLLAKLYLPGWDLDGRRTRIALPALVAATIAAYTYFPLETAAVIGTIGIVLWFFLCLALACSLATRLSDRWEVPVVVLTLFAAITFSALNLNDNHAVRTSPREAVRLPPIEQAFREWYAARSNKENFKGQPYPVFLVSAAGGGLYAAQHTAKVLSRLQDLCPRFVHHIFAISSVSGGSVGAAVFASLIKKKAESAQIGECHIEFKGKGEIEEAAEAVLDHDFLGPLVGATLFPDFLQRFLPFSLEFFDRGKTVDQAVEAAWGNVMQAPGALSAPYLDHWSARGVSPALLLNTTSVERGHRVVATPFQISTLGSAFTGLTGLWELHYLLLNLAPGADAALALADIKQDIKLSTAAGMTTRFPWVAPAATIPLQGNPVRLVDGGYYENSGMETVRDVLDNLKQFENSTDPKSEAGRPLVRFYLISIDGIEDLDKPGSRGMGELLSPIRAMLSSRSQRGYLALYRAISERSPECILPGLDPDKCDRFRWKLFFLNHSDFNLPLGWHLSPPTNSIIDLHSGYPTRDSSRRMAFESKNRDERMRGFVELANDSACQVIRVLEGRAGELCSTR